MRTILITVLLCGGATLTTPAVAGGTDRPSTIRTSDLDLSRPGDMVELRRRARRAIDDACGPYAGANPDTIPAIARCRAQASASVRDATAPLIARAGRTETAARR